MFNKHVNTTRLFLILFIFVFIFFTDNKIASAQGAFLNSVKSNAVTADPMSIKVDSPVGDIYASQLNALATQGNTQAETSWLKSFANWASDKYDQISWSQIFNTTLTNSLNKIAFDTASWLGSGGKGQKPMFITEGWGEYLSNIGDNAAGIFIEQLGRKGFGGTKFNLCSPDLEVQIKIGLGLINTYQPKKPACTFTQLKKNWENELTKPDFLSRFQTMFSPDSNDLGIALALQTGIMEQVQSEKLNKTLSRQDSKGWLSVESLIDGKIVSPPNETERQILQAYNLKVANYAKYSGDALIDAANIFLNQLALSSFNTLMRKLGEGKDTSTHPFDWNKLTNYNAGPSGGGTSATKERLKKFFEPKFNVRGDYNILSELSQCPEPTKAGPTNCVIEDKFRQGIEQNETVKNAIDKGYLNSNATFGFVSPQLEPSYLEGYPYRSIIILRKFRILPVGWEVAAQYIKEHPDVQEKTLGQLVACFNQDKWCKNLVDPNWVLKAPLNYCKLEGPGPEITSTNVIGEGTDSKLSISRNDKYCADEQSCVKENDDGSCKFYGYCTEEKRQWKFDSDSCQPIYNTCQTFKQEDGNSVSYLENTLDFAGCSVDNAGCTAFCTKYDNGTGKYGCTSASANDKIYLDKSAESCDQQSEGCHGLIRTKQGIGTNLIVNSDFESNLTEKDWNASVAWSTWGSAVSDGYSGANALKFSAAGAYNQSITISPSMNFAVRGEAYSLSFYAKNCNAGSNFSMEDQADSTALAVGDNWQFFQTSHIFQTDNNTIKLIFNVVNSECTIDSIKLERNQSATPYSQYGTAGLVYEKLAPDYLTCTGASTDPSECKNFARKCEESEVGCEMYTSVNSKENIPAKVKSEDYCVSQCVGYDTFIQSETAFDSSRPEYFIPKTAKSCSAQANGCDQFTNLDKLSKGGEATEYFSYLRQCIKPDQSSCGDYYAWEGSAESGYQLKVLNLKSAGNQPAITGNSAEENAKCNATIYKLSSTDPAYNSDCREFYDSSGNKTYHLYSQTISCSDDCHPYRRSELNTDPNINQAACVGTDRNWDTEKQECMLCKDGGTLSDDKKSCIYNAIPDQGLACSAAEAGCREYTGNTGQNTRIILNDDFEDGTKQGWDFIAGAPVVSTESINNGGHSLQINNAQFAAYKTVGSLIDNSKAYTLTFMAKGQGNIDFYIHKALSKSGGVINSANTLQQFQSINLNGSDWNRYQINIDKLNIPEPISGDELLVIDGSNNFFIDNIRFTEITDRFYLIKNSWQTPDACNQDLFGNPAALYMLGCDEYRDRDNQTHYLKSFSALCGESGVGCELMIDTHNTDNPKQQIYNDSDALSRTTVPEDNFIFAIYDKNKLCDAADKGCQRLGKPYSYENSLLYQDIYLKNNPNDYSKIMCASDAVNCNEYSTETGMKYFKNPGDMACEWRQGYQENMGWYKKKIKRCNGTGSVCLQDKDCISGQTCKLEEKDTLCNTDANALPKTFGKGNEQISQPSNGWAGYCTVENSGCTELIDPNSSFSGNIVFNGNFMNLDNNPVGQTYDDDGWQANSQGVSLEAFTLYRLAGSGNSGNSVVVSGCAGGSILSELDPETNRLTGPNSSVTLSLSNSYQSKSFYVKRNTDCKLNVGSTANTKVELKKVVIDYKLNEALDANSCNGVVNLDDGCVLFNKRTQNGSSTASLVYDADVNSPTPVNAGSIAGADSNALIKVIPDRVCDKWLTCASKVAYKDSSGKENNYCTDIGLCNQLDDKGNCSNLLVNKQVDQIENLADGLSADKINLTGYSKVSYSGVKDQDMRGDYPFNRMQQLGEFATVSNGSFELNSNLKPSSWNLESGGVWQPNQFKVIDNPVAAQNENIRYPIDGRAFLRAGAEFKVKSEIIPVVNGKYILTVHVNTLNLSSGKAIITAKTENGTIIKSTELPARNDWTIKVMEFDVESSSLYISISSDSKVGNIYVDNLKLAPALQSRDNWLTTQSCRLYPEADSLACDYSSDSGMKYKGWKGYCLEYDRKPGDPNTCLLWWPGERVKGDSVISEGGAGFQGAGPLYYCTQGTAERTYEYRHAFFVGRQQWDMCGGVTCPGGYKLAIAGYSSVSGAKDYSTCICEPIKDNKENNPIKLDGSEDNFSDECSNGGCPSFGIQGAFIPVSENDGWYEYNDNIVNFANQVTITSSSTIAQQNGYGLNPYAAALCGAEVCSLNNEIFRSSLRCTDVAKVVTESGENMYWSGRVSEGSNYRLPTLNLPYDTDYNPFGALIPPEPAGDPTQWDSVIDVSDNIETIGNQPLYYQSPNTKLANPYQPRAGFVFQCNNPNSENTNCNYVLNDSTSSAFPYYYLNRSVGVNGTDLLRNLFAKGFGTWTWNVPNKRYEQSTFSWGSPGTICAAGTDPDTRSNCAIAPIVSNVRVNNVGDKDVALNKSGFINLTFNSTVDSQQLPLVMYQVDWGDSLNTTVSGVELSDQPNVENPHSLYHLYSFWDLKSKAASGVGNVTCNDTECRIKPNIKIQDNWGWCNGGVKDNCTRVQAFPEDIVVRIN